ncbi:hypothetical protein ACWGF3_22565 [Streptomyces xanthophaeus]
MAGPLSDTAGGGHSVPRGGEQFRRYLQEHVAGRTVAVRLVLDGARTADSGMDNGHFA